MVVNRRGAFCAVGGGRARYEAWCATVRPIEHERGAVQGEDLLDTCIVCKDLPKAMAKRVQANTEVAWRGALCCLAPDTAYKGRFCNPAFAVLPLSPHVANAEPSSASLRPFKALGVNPPSGRAARLIRRHWHYKLTWADHQGPDGQVWRGPCYRRESSLHLRTCRPSGPIGCRCDITLFVAAHELGHDTCLSLLRAQNESLRALGSGGWQYQRRAEPIRTFARSGTVIGLS